MGFRLRRFLPAIEILSGFFAIGMAAALRSSGGYMNLLPLPAMISLLALPSFAIGCSIPLYAYYYRRVRFKFLYAVYNLGAVLSIFLIEFLLFPRLLQSSLLALIGLFHVVLGLVILALYRKGVFEVAVLSEIKVGALVKRHGLLLATAFGFSFFSSYFHFWG